MDQNPTIKVEVGCGASPRPGYIHSDLRPLPHVEQVCPAWAISFPVRSVDEIYSRHLLEHLSRAEAGRALRHWYAILKIGGSADLCVPDLEKHIEQFRLEGQSPYLERPVSNRDHALAGFYGWQEHEGDFHRWGYTWETLKEMLLEAGFDQVERIADDSKAAGVNLRVRATKKSGAGIETPDPEAGRYPRPPGWWSRMLAWLTGRPMAQPSGTGRIE